MDTFGETLKAEREDRGLTLESVAQTVGVDHERLRALERNEFGDLPDEDTMMSCLHAYADCLGVDAEMMIEDYVKERDRWLRELDQAISTPSVEAAPEVSVERGPETADSDGVARGPRVFGVLAFGAAIVILVTWWALSGNGASPTPPDKAIADPSEASHSSSVRPAPPPTRDAAASSPETPAAPARERASSASPEDSIATDITPAAVDPPVERPAPVDSAPGSDLTIPDSGVGTGVDHRQLVGRSDRFREGTPVWFWTHVEGGNRGDRIDHVWIHDGVEATRVPLNIGASHWRTYSTKLLGPGSVGRWSVEARDETGRVLVRHEFVVEPASDS